VGGCGAPEGQNMAKLGSPLYLGMFGSGDAKGRPLGRPLSRIGWVARPSKRRNGHLSAFESQHR
jgi:hypothetical protein